MKRIVAPVEAIVTLIRDYSKLCRRAGTGRSWNRGIRAGQRINRGEIKCRQQVNVC